MPSDPLEKIQLNIAHTVQFYLKIALVGAKRERWEEVHENAAEAAKYADLAMKLKKAEDIGKEGEEEPHPPPIDVEEQRTSD